jgi:GDP-mannose transporter
VLPVAFQSAAACALLETLKWQRAVSYERINVFDAFSSTIGARNSHNVTSNKCSSSSTIDSSSAARGLTGAHHRAQGLAQTQARAVLPLSLSFVGMIFSGFMCLKYLNVPMATIFKNATNLLIVTGEWWFYAEPVSFGVVASVAMMVVGAAAAAANDLDFSAQGLAWACANACATATYVLYMRQVTRTVDLSRFGTVLLNNALSAVLLLMVAAWSGELAEAVASATDGLLWRRASAFDLSSSNNIGSSVDMGYVGLNIFTGLVGFLLNFAQLWCVGATSATTYAIIGTLNKIPIALFGQFLFKTKMTPQGWVFVGVNLVGCSFYSYCKLMEKRSKSSETSNGPSAVAVPSGEEPRGRDGSKASNVSGVSSIRSSYSINGNNGSSYSNHGSSGSKREELQAVAEHWDREARGRSGSFPDDFVDPSSLDHSSNVEEHSSSSHNDTHAR